MNNKKTDREMIEEMYGVLFGNPDHQIGLITRVELLEKAVRNNTRLTWVVLGVIVMAAISILFK